MKRIILLLVVLNIVALARYEAHAQADTTFSVTTSANPFDDQITLNITLANKNVTGLKIFDAIGKEITSDISIYSAKNQGFISFTLDFSTIKPGIYFCSIYSDKGIIETRKLFRSAR